MRPALTIVAFVLALAAPLAAQDVAEPIRLEGRVVDPRGRPLDDVELRPVWTSTSRVGDVIVTTGADGRFAVEANRSWFRLESRIESPAVLVSRRGRVSVVLAIWPEEVQATARHELGDVVLLPGVNLRGMVRTADGAPLADAIAVATDAAAFVQMAQFGGLMDPLSIGLGEKVPYAIARSGADGRFDLRGTLPFGTRIQVSRPGYGTVTTMPVGVGDPIDVELQRTGFARGSTVDAAGAPVADALVYLVDESGSFTMSRSATDGAFELPLRSRNRYMVEAQAQLQITRQPGAGIVGWQDAPADDLRVVPIGLTADAPSFPVRVVDADSGEPIEGAQVGVGWADHFASMAANSPDLESWFGYGQPAADGVPRARAPLEGEDARGALLARAPGYATVVVPVAWTTGGIEPTVELRPGAKLTGKVVVEGTGEPVPHALVTVQTDDSDATAPLRLAGPNGRPIGARTRTAPDGSFELRDLPSGERSVTVLVGDRPRPEPRVVELRADGELADLEIAVPRGVTVTGRISGAGATTGLWVRLRQDSENFVAPGAMTSPDGSVRSARVGDDGRYALHGMPAGAWEVELVAPHSQLGASAHTVRLGSLDLGTEDRTHDIAAPRMTPGRVAGTVDRAGAQISYGRLVVVAEPLSDDELPAFYSPTIGLRAYVDRGGAYELTLPPGRWALNLHDAVTGVRLATTDQIKVETGGNLHRDFRADCGAVRIRFVPASGDDPFVGQRVSIEPSDPGLQPDAFIGLMSAWLPARAGEHVVFLPLESHELAFWATRAGEGNPLLDPLNRSGSPAEMVTVRPRADEVVEVEFRAPAR